MFNIENISYFINLDPDDYYSNDVFNYKNNVEVLKYYEFSQYTY